MCSSVTDSANLTFYIPIRSHMLGIAAIDRRAVDTALASQAATSSRITRQEFVSVTVKAALARKG